MWFDVFRESGALKNFAVPFPWEDMSNLNPLIAYFFGIKGYFIIPT